jgi:LCP family protein required for cell wall assembly
MLTLLTAFSLGGFMLRSETLRGVVGGMLGQTPENVFKGNTLTLLVLGCDEDRYYGGKQILSSSARSDMMLLAKLDFDRKTISALSIPRDTFIRHRNVGYKHSDPRITGSRINAFHSFGGPDLAQQAVERTFDVTVDRTVVLNFEAFQELIDLLGGIEVYIQKDMEYKDVRGGLDIDLKKGRQVLTGYQAMGYVRFRKGAGESDFTRQDRQKELIMAIKDKILQQPTLIPLVADKTVEILDRRLTGGELGSLIWFAQQVPTEGIKMGSMPVNEPKTRGAAYLLYLDRDKLPEVLQEFGFKTRTSARTSSNRES